MTLMITSTRDAALLLNVQPATVRRWVAAGKLPPGPWLAEALPGLAPPKRGGAPRGANSPHGTAARWRAGCGCEECRATGRIVEASKVARRAYRFWTVEGKARDLIALLAAGTPYAKALAQAGTSASAVTAHRYRDRGFAAELDKALIAGRDPALRHGHTSGWAAGCRCPDCRNYRRRFSSRSGSHPGRRPHE